MALLSGNCLEVLEATEVVTMVTNGPDGPHLTATWGDYVRKMGIEGDRLLIPAGYYRHMEANLQDDPRVQILIASRQVQGSMGPGQGYTLKGRAVVATSGADVDRVKAAFPWARAAVIVEVQEAIAHL
jgi:hypothetical protein